MKNLDYKKIAESHANVLRLIQAKLGHPITCACVKSDSCACNCLKSQVRRTLRYKPELHEGRNGAS